MAQVEIVVDEPVRVVAVVTRDAVEELGLRPGHGRDRDRQVDVGDGRATDAQPARRCSRSSPRRCTRRRGHPPRPHAQITVFAAASLTDVFPQIDRARALLVRRLEHARRADPAGRAGRRLRLREHDAAAAAATRRGSCSKPVVFTRNKLVARSCRASNPAGIRSGLRPARERHRSSSIAGAGRPGRRATRCRCCKNMGLLGACSRTSSARRRTCARCSRRSRSARPTPASSTRPTRGPCRGKVKVIRCPPGRSRRCSTAICVVVEQPNSADAQAFVDRAAREAGRRRSCVAAGFLPRVAPMKRGACGGARSRSSRLRPSTLAFLAAADRRDLRRVPPGATSSTSSRTRSSPTRCVVTPEDERRRAGADPAARDADGRTCSRRRRFRGRAARRHARRAAARAAAGRRRHRAARRVRPHRAARLARRRVRDRDPVHADRRRRSPSRSWRARSTSARRSRRSRPSTRTSSPRRARSAPGRRGRSSASSLPLARGGLAAGARARRSRAGSASSARRSCSPAASRASRRRCRSRSTRSSTSTSTTALAIGALLVVDQRRAPRRPQAELAMARSRADFALPLRAFDVELALEVERHASRSSGRRAPARRRCCARSPGWRGRSAAGSRSATSVWFDARTAHRPPPERAPGRARLPGLRALPAPDGARERRVRRHGTRRRAARALPDRAPRGGAAGGALRRRAPAGRARARARARPGASCSSTSRSSALDAHTKAIVRAELHELLARARAPGAARHARLRGRGGARRPGRRARRRRAAPARHRRRSSSPRPRTRSSPRSPARTCCAAHARAARRR